MKGQVFMKKRIPYIAALVWMMAVTVLAFLDGLTWSRERMRSSWLDGCEKEDRIYLVENMKEDGILYIMDSDGSVKHVTLSSSVKEGSIFGKIACKDHLYGVLVNEERQGEETGPLYTIVQFDEEGRPAVCSLEFAFLQQGQLTGFCVDEYGFYLTALQEGGKSASAYFIDMESLTAESDETVVLKVHQMVHAQEGRSITAARFEGGNFQLWLDDGSGVEAFTASRKLQTAFWYRSLSVRQLMELRQERMILYVQVFLAGYVVLFTIMMLLRNRSHTVYTIAIVESALLAMTLAGAVQVPRIQEKARQEEARRFGYYYVRALSEEIEDPGTLNPEGEGFYDGNDYEAVRERLTRFVHLDDMAEVFTDICLVSSRDHRILVSANGYNGKMFEEVYAAGSGELIRSLAEQGRGGSRLIGIEGITHQVVAVAASDDIFPEYLLLGVIRQDAPEGFFGGNRAVPLYAAAVFLLGSAVSIWLLVLQGRELQHLATAMQALAGGDTVIKKAAVHGKDVDFMWNSLMETRKTISRINYTRYRILESCYRFAPKNIEKILGKDSITEVNSGDMVLLHGTMAVVSCAEAKEEGRVLADRMNAFVSMLEKHQEESGGFFVSGHGSLDMMKVLFLDESRNTVDFGVALMHGFLEQSVLETTAGILLHYSQYMYGVAGTDRHSLPYLLSREMDELERYARWFQSLKVRLVITESVKNREYLDGAFRYLGYLRIPDSQERMRVYEVLDACPLLEGKKKAQTDEKFQKGLKLFYQHDFYLARSTFNDVLRENPEDSMAKWYLFTCERYLNQIDIKGDICRLHWESGFLEG